MEKDMNNLDIGNHPEQEGQQPQAHEACKLMK
jgi:hypothetical protein